MGNKLRIAIVGGGIGGLTLALLFASAASSLTSTSRHQS